MKYILGPIKHWHQRQPQYSFETAPSLFLIIVYISCSLCGLFYGFIALEVGVPLIRAANQPDGFTWPNLLTLLGVGIVAAMGGGYGLIFKRSGEELYKRWFQ